MTYIIHAKVEHVEVMFTDVYGLLEFPCIILKFENAKNTRPIIASPQLFHVVHAHAKADMMQLMS